MFVFNILWSLLNHADLIFQTAVSVFYIFYILAEVDQHGSYSQLPANQCYSSQHQSWLSVFNSTESFLSLRFVGASFACVLGS
jgi:hypothetical protein